MNSAEVWQRIEAAKQDIKRELASLSGDIGPEYDISVDINWSTSGSSAEGVNRRHPTVEVTVSMKTMSGYTWWASMGDSEEGERAIAESIKAHRSAPTTGWLE